MDDDSFSTRGGMWLVDRHETPWTYFGRTRNTATWPFAKLHVTREQLTISSLMMGPFVVTHGNLESITRFGSVPIIASGLRFEAYFRQQVAVFWAFDRSMVIAELADRGWTVDEQP